MVSYTWSHLSLKASIWSGHVGIISMYDWWSPKQVYAQSYVDMVEIAFKSRSPDSDLCQFLSPCLFFLLEIFSSPNYLCQPVSDQCLSKTLWLPTLLPCSLGNVSEKLHSYTSLPLSVFLYAYVHVYVYVDVCISIIFPWGLPIQRVRIELKLYTSLLE